MNEQNRKKLYIIGGIVALIALFVSFIVFEVNNDKILKNTYINEVNVGGLTKEQAKIEIEKKYKVGPLEFLYKDNEWILKENEFDFNYDLSSVIDKAYNIKKEGSILKNIETIINSKTGKETNLEIKITYNEQKLKNKLQDISKEINVDMKNASINIKDSKINIEDGNDGLSLNIDKNLEYILKELKVGKKEIKLQVDKRNQDISKEEVEKVDTLLATYSTKFNSSVYGRTTNIKIAAQRTSDALLMPGDTFSYNEHTGLRTASNGYKNAPVIVQGVVQEGIGGGVCQVSSTLYNSVLLSGLELVNIKNHSIPSTYVPKGRDATVTDSGIDFVFKNNLTYPVYIKNYVSGNTVTCQVYGSSKDKKNIYISTNTDNVSPAPIKKVDDPSLYIGEKKELESPRDGYTISTYRIYKDKNGTTIKQEKVATSYYPKKQGIVAVGTMEKTVNPPIEPEKPTPPVEPPTQPEEPDNEQKPEGGDEGQNPNAISYTLY